MFDRRAESELPGVLTSISRFLANDVSWPQTSILSSFALLSICFIFLISKMLPEFVAQDIPEPVEIMIEMIEQTVTKPQVPDPVSTPVNKENPTEKRILSDRQIENTSKKSEMPAFQELKPEPTQEIILPEAKIHSRPTQRALKSKRSDAPQISNPDAIMKSEKIDIGVVPDISRYQATINERTQPEKDPVQAVASTRFIHQLPNHPSSVVLPDSNPKKVYERSPEKQISNMPLLNTQEFPIKTRDERIATDLTSHYSQRNYEIKDTHETPMMDSSPDHYLKSDAGTRDDTIGPLKSTQKNYQANAASVAEIIVSDKAETLISPVNHQTASIAPAGSLKKDYHAVAAHKVTMVTSDKAASLVTKPKKKSGVIAPVNRPQKSYRNIARKTTVTSIPSETGEPLLSNPAASTSLVDPLLNPKKNYEIEAVNSIEAKKIEDKSLSFRKVTTEDIDPANLMSLKELAVCTDPEEEFYLKTELATLLNGPTKCETQGMLLFFKYVESGYTIRVEIYNPGGILLKDRCSVLQMGLEGVRDLKAKGVIP